MCGLARWTLVLALHIQGAQWLESQNTVLEEVDQLVELMAVEKEVMNREISKLRVSRATYLACYGHVRGCV